MTKDKKLKTAELHCPLDNSIVWWRDSLVVGIALLTLTCRYWCRRCQLEYLQDKVNHRYCVGLTVTNHIVCTDVVVFGKSLNSIFGASASEFHR